MVRRIQSHWRLVTVALLVSLVMLVTHAVFGTPAGSSYKHNLPWFEGFQDAFWQGVLYPRVLPELWFGMGGFDFYFYGPMPFWIASLLGPVVCPGCDTSQTFSVVGALMMIASGATFFLFARRFFDVPWAGIGALVFVLLPYHYLSDWFARQAVGEVAAFIFLPLLALASVKLIEEKKGGILFAFSFAAIALSHLPTTLILVHVVAALVGWVALTRETDWSKRSVLVGRFALWGGLGAALSAFYWWPALSLLPLASADNLYSAYFDATRWLFLDGQAEPSAKTALTSKWQLALVIAAAIVSYFLFKRETKPQALRDWIFVPSVIAVFMMTIVSYPIWQFWIVNMVQFPSRFLIMTDLSIALAAAFLAQHIARVGYKKLSPAVQRGALACIAAFAMAAFSAVLQAQFAAERTFAIERKLDHSGPPEYVPQALFKANMKRLNQTVTEETSDNDRYAQFFVEMERGRGLGEAAMTSASPQSQITPVDGRGFDISVTLDAPTTVPVPVAAWPYWEATARDGGSVAISTHETLGLVQLDLPAGQSEIQLRLTQSPAERVATLISTISFLALVIAMIVGRVGVFGRFKANSRKVSPA